MRLFELWLRDAVPMPTGNTRCVRASGQVTLDYDAGLATVTVAGREPFLIPVGNIACMTPLPKPAKAEKPAA